MPCTSRRYRAASALRSFGGQFVMTVVNLLSPSASPKFRACDGNSSRFR
jgi:hypothetical protein